MSASPLPASCHLSIYLALPKLSTLLERGEQTSPSHLERDLAVPTPPIPSIVPSGTGVFPLPWHHPAAALGTRQHSWQVFGLGWSSSGVDKLGVLKPPATSIMSPKVPPLPPGRTVPPATAACPSYPDNSKGTSTPHWALSQPPPPAHPSRSTLLKMIYWLLSPPSQAAPLQRASRTEAWQIN